MDGSLGVVEDYNDDIDSLSADYSAKSDYSKGRIVESAVMRCIELRSKEMKPGYFNYIVKNEVVNKVWVPDSREEFIGSVKALRSLLSSEIKEIEGFESSEKEINEKMKELFDRYSYSEDGVKRMPFTDEVVKVIKVKVVSGREHAIKEHIPGAWNEKVNAYKNNLVPLYDELFSLLNKLIHAKNYFKKTMRIG